MAIKSFNYNFDKNANYLLACSYGPDSMALCDMLYKAKCKFVICFVNYHKRPESDQEQIDITKYCEDKKIRLEILDTKGLKVEGNFQEWARETRYAFFQRMYKKYNAVGVFVAHHQDDLIETYLLQKERKGNVKEYGMSEITALREMCVIRPLLMYTKADLLEYCKENMVPYSIDMSNFEDKYLRNRIRHTVIDNLSEIDRENIIQEIKDANNKIADINDRVENKVVFGSELDIRVLISLEPGEFTTALYNFVAKSPVHIDLSAGRISEIRKVLLSRTPNVQMKLAEGVYLIKEYDVITLGLDEGNDVKEYSYVLEKPGVLNTVEFDLDFSMGAEDRKISIEDYPLTIRSARPDDLVEVGHHFCEARRLFIDWKVPTKYRKMWPVFVNKSGRIIYVPRYRKTFVDNHKSKFVIKFTHTKEIK